MKDPVQAEAQVKLTADQRKTAMLRSHLSGHHPKLSGGNDCLSRKQGQLKSHQSAGAPSSDLHEGLTESRRALNGTVVHQ
eukprot:CAMPEP_0181323592 /NCGR_PEP_ID=MMETSP1101-20121128/19876_1 /TAXON_ID=46948 /ORGANISM="Rhodomonas abbreviata, Strain Caron Lab Isolate" /LENGTH=79 /DNA_ID=CAMNT_0023431647 /DNA_START=86 /DNA_END=325 /DNA_ORIENTATION=-